MTETDPIDRLQRLESIFNAAMDLASDARPAYVRAACDGDAPMLKEVERLLASENATDFMADGALAERRAETAVWRASPTGDAAKAGDELGPYRLTALIARGGMGEVWRAAREGEFEREVALKLIKRGIDTDEVIERFRTERQVLAGLQHPNIANLLDGGATPSGQPYLVMEHVAGEAIDRYCEERGLSIEDRLRLFVKVCEAVHHAHRSLIIHRDLKPGNILVTAAGEPKLLDFGIAKVLDPAGTDADVTATQLRRFTPHYASPEQVRGEVLTTATDVYSLGALLYELLTGARPYDLTDVPPTDFTRIICETEPRRPSDVVQETSDPATRRRRRGLAGDVDRIVMMALRKEPDRRYDSVEQLADDVRRHLDGLPVRAQPDTFGYRAGKFARRHRTGLSAGGMLAMALVAGLIGTAWQARRAEAARDDAVVAQQEEKAAREDAEAVNLFLFNLFRSADPREGDAAMTLREAMDVAADRVDLDLAKRPLAQAYVRLSLGMTFRTLSELDAAGPHIERAIAIYERELGGEDVQTLSARHELALIRMDQGQFDEADAIARDVLARRRRVLGPERSATLMTLTLVARTAKLRGEADEAMQLLEELIAIRERTDPDGTGLLVNRKELANLLARADRTDEAVKILEKVLADQERLLGPDHLDTIITISDMATAYSQAGQPVEAEALYRRALERMIPILEPDHFDRLIVELNLGVAIHRGKRYGEAAAHLRDVVARAEASLGAEHYVTTYARMRFGISLLRNGERDEAAVQLRRAHEVFLRDFGPEHGYTVEAAEWVEKLE